MPSGEHVLFVGVERPGLIAVYTLHHDDDVLTLRNQSLYYGAGSGRTWQELYDAREAKAIDVEDMRSVLFCKTQSSLH